MTNKSEDNILALIESILESREIIREKYALQNGLEYTPPPDSVFVNRIEDTDVDRLMRRGFSEDVARKALSASNGDFAQAVNNLLKADQNEALGQLGTDIRGDITAVRADIAGLSTDIRDRLRDFRTDVLASTTNIETSVAQLAASIGPLNTELKDIAITELLAKSKYELPQVEIRSIVPSMRDQDFFIVYAYLSIFAEGNASTPVTHWNIVKDLTFGKSNFKLDIRELYTNMRIVFTNATASGPFTPATKSFTTDQNKWFLQLCCYRYNTTEGKKVIDPIDDLAVFGEYVKLVKASNKKPITTPLASMMGYIPAQIWKEKLRFLIVRIETPATPPAGSGVHRPRKAIKGKVIQTPIERWKAFVGIYEAGNHSREMKEEMKKHLKGMLDDGLIQKVDYNFVSKKYKL